MVKVRHVVFSEKQGKLAFSTKSSVDMGEMVRKQRLKGRIYFVLTYYV